ncbi:unnamed protein product [Gongylonema pulchrum]|uniref:NADH dehydrogenase subunit 1 n=1 Tax=Gongylonema pulchrum TaxID=637853 RepID=A0A183EJZ0_9BILA|nr:unnamed protein product [Gongylonema pulchrum]
MGSCYETIKFFLIAMLLFELIILMPFAVSGLVVLIDIAALILLMGSCYETIKFFLIAMLLFELVILMPFAVSGLNLAITTSKAPVEAISGSWIQKFNLIQHHSSNLMPPQVHRVQLQAF